jgi:tRNA-splicing ligase RtcB
MGSCPSISKEIDALIQILRNGKESDDEPVMRGSPLPFFVCGSDLIESKAKEQMESGMRLPVTVAGALLPDSHLGYSVPIGSVLASENVVIPSAVGVDIGCGVKFSLFSVNFPVAGSPFYQRLREAIRTQTVFGKCGNDRDGLIPFDLDYSVLDSPLWTDIPILKKHNLRDLACRQIGTSGGGNHFCDAGVVSVDGCDRLAIMTHGGSRGVGYKIAKLFTNIAKQRFNDKDLRELAWLGLDEEDGQEYWQAMNLCAAFARTNHEIIHQRISAKMGIDAGSVESVFTNHNMAGQERIDVNGLSRDVIVHRKGAVRVETGEYGIIAGSMATPSYVVRGKGFAPSMNSCSHGSGRVMGRKEAKKMITSQEMRDSLSDAGIDLIGGGIDECPMAYKELEIR